MNIKPHSEGPGRRMSIEDSWAMMTDSERWKFRLEWPTIAMIIEVKLGIPQFTHDTEAT